MSCVNSISLKIAVGCSDNLLYEGLMITKHGCLLFCCFNLPCVILMIFGCIVEMAARKEKYRYDYISHRSS